MTSFYAKFKDHDRVGNEIERERQRCRKNFTIGTWAELTPMLVLHAVASVSRKDETRWRMNLYTATDWLAISM